ncbi:MAG: acyl-ACP--UDP-N-acetylglucosamine O-acyltransferase [Rhizobiaceae bacterium]
MANEPAVQSSGTFIHPLADVAPGAQLGAGVRVGPFCQVGPEAVLHENVELISHVSVMGATEIGAGTRVFPQAVLGGAPQNFKHEGGRTTLTIGRGCTIREMVTAHVGTDTSRGATQVGDNCMLMAYSHVAHDCVLGDHVTFANGVTLGGHVEVGDHAIISGLSAIHQFVRIGHHAFVGGMTGVPGDVIPYGMVIGNRARLRGLNVIGLKRSGLSRAEIHVLRSAYRLLFDRARPVAENVDAVRAAHGDDPRVADILDFVTNRGTRIFCVPAVSGTGTADEGDD